MHYAFECRWNCSQLRFVCLYQGSRPRLPIQHDEGIQSTPVQRLPVKQCNAMHRFLDCRKRAQLSQRIIDVAAGCQVWGRRASSRGCRGGGAPGAFCGPGIAVTAALQQETRSISTCHMAFCSQNSTGHDMICERSKPTCGCLVVLGAHAPCAGWSGASRGSALVLNRLCTPNF